MTPQTETMLNDWMAEIETPIDTRPPIKIEAVVKFNDSEAYVFNRMPEFLYQFEGRDLIARDGPFADALRYEQPRGRFKAFGGREIRFPMLDGTTTIGTGEYWACGVGGMVSATYSTKASLLKCYVFTGASVCPVAMEKLRSEYTGDVYPYYAYEAVIKAPELRRKALYAERRFERAKKHILSNLQAIKAERDELMQSALVKLEAAQ